MLSPSVKRIIRWLASYRVHVLLAVSLFVAAIVGGNVAGALELKYLVDAVDRSDWGLLVLFWAIYAFVGTLTVPVYIALSVFFLGAGVYGSL